MKISLNFGKGQQTLAVAAPQVVGVLQANELAGVSPAEVLLQQSLDAPIGTAPLEELVRPGEKVCIITSDITRPVPSHLIIPPVLERLERAGVRREDVTVVFALGSHRRHTPDEMRSLVGEQVYETVDCVDSADDFVRVGVSRRGTPYDVFAPVVQCDRRICIGNIEYHYFAGYSGGAKAVMPGVCSRDSIQSNHSRMVMAEAKAGALEGNPVREDIDEVTDFVSIDFIVNVVLDEQKRICQVVSGHWKQAHRVGCRGLDQMYRVDIPQKADIVVVSPGGFPKDINLYQAQKALDNAKHAVRKGGVIVLAASCAEGLGERVFEEWMLQHTQPSQMIEHIRQDFQLGGHKAAAIAMVLEDAQILLVSDLPDDFVRRIHMEPWPDLQSAYDHAQAKFEGKGSVIVMPYGGSTLPYLQ